MTSTRNGAPTQWLTVAEAAEKLQLKPSAVVRETRGGWLVGVRRNKELQIPAELVTTDERVAKHLGGILTVLRDHGFDDDELIEWLYSHDETLDAVPIELLYTDRAREVKRRAQALL